MAAKQTAQEMQIWIKSVHNNKTFHPGDIQKNREPTEVPTKHITPLDFTLLIHSHYFL